MLRHRGVDAQLALAKASHRPSTATMREQVITLLEAGQLNEDAHHH